MVMNSSSDFCGGISTSADGFSAPAAGFSADAGCACVLTVGAGAVLVYDVGCSLLFFLAASLHG